MTMPATVPIPTCSNTNWAHSPAVRSSPAAIACLHQRVGIDRGEEIRGAGAGSLCADDLRRGDAGMAFIPAMNAHGPGERGEKEDRGQREPVIEARLNIDGFPNAGGRALAGHHRIAKGRVSGRKDRREQKQFINAQRVAPENPRRARTRHNHERQRDDEQAQGQHQLPQVAAEIGARGVREKQKGEGEFREEVKPAPINIDVDNAKAQLARADAYQEKHQRRS